MQTQQISLQCALPSLVIDFGKGFLHRDDDVKEEVVVVVAIQRRIEFRHWSGWKLTGLGGGGAGTTQSRSLMLRTGVAGLFSVDASVAFKLANKSSPEVTSRMFLRGGVTGRGDAI